MSKLLFKQISILSAIFGGILGILCLIPFIRIFAAFGIIFLIAPIVLIYLKKLNILKEISTSNGMIYGTIAGIVSMLAFVFVITPFILIFGLIIKQGNIHWWASGIKNMGFFVYLMILFFFCIINALTNAFSGLATAYLYDFLKNVKD